MQVVQSHVLIFRDRESGELAELISTDEQNENLIVKYFIRGNVQVVPAASMIFVQRLPTENYILMQQESYEELTAPAPLRKRRKVEEYTHPMEKKSIISAIQRGIFSERDLRLLTRLNHEWQNRVNDNEIWGTLLRRDYPWVYSELFMGITSPTLIPMLNNLGVANVQGDRIVKRTYEFFHKLVTGTNTRRFQQISVSGPDWAPSALAKYPNQIATIQYVFTTGNRTFILFEPSGTGKTPVVMVSIYATIDMFTRGFFKANLSSFEKSILPDIWQDETRQISVLFRDYDYGFIRDITIMRYEANGAVLLVDFSMAEFPVFVGYDSASDSYYLFPDNLSFRPYQNTGASVTIGTATIGFSNPIYIYYKETKKGLYSEGTLLYQYQDLYFIQRPENNLIYLYNAATGIGYDLDVLPDFYSEFRAIFVRFLRPGENYQPNGSFVPIEVGRDVNVDEVNNRSLEFFINAGQFYIFVPQSQNHLHVFYKLQPEQIQLVSCDMCDNLTLGHSTCEFCMEQVFCSKHCGNRHLLVHY